MIISVCVGSSCHLKNSYGVIALFKEAITKHQLEDKVELKASFCLNNCINGVSVKIDDAPCQGVSLNDFDTFFNDKVTQKVK